MSINSVITQRFNLIHLMYFFLLLGWSVNASQLPLHQWQNRFWNQSHGLPHISVNTISYGADGRLWLGTERGLANFDGIKFNTIYAKDEAAIHSDWITQLYLDQQKRLWIGTIKNLAVLQDGKFHSIEADATAPLGTINGIAQAGNQIWVAANQLYQLRDQRLEQYAPWQGAASALKASDDGLWVAGQGQLWLIAETIKKFNLPAQMKSVRISAIEQTGDILWLASNAGLLQMKDGVFSYFHFEQDDQNVLSIANDSGDLLVSFKNVFYRINKGSIVERVPDDAPEFPVFSRTMLVDQDGFWTGSQTDGLRYYWRSAVKVDGVASGLQSSMVWSVYPGSNGLLVGTQNGVALWQEGKLSPFTDVKNLPNPMVYNVFYDSQQRVWAGTRTGMACFNPQGELLFWVKGLEDVQINGMLEDASGTLWVVTSKGVFQVVGDTALVPKVASFPIDRFRAVLEQTADKLWFGSDHGLYQLKGGELHKVTEPVLQQSMITAIAALDEERLAVGTYDQGLFIFNNNSWIHYAGTPTLPSQTIFSLLVHQDRLLLSTPEGAFSLPLAELGSAKAEDKTLPLQVLLYDVGQRYGKNTVRCCNGAGTAKSAQFDQLAFFPSTQGLVSIDLNRPEKALPQATIYGYQIGEQRHPYVRHAKLALGERELQVNFGAIDFAEGDLLQFRYRLSDGKASWRELSETYHIYLDDVRPGPLHLEVQARRPLGQWGSSAVIEFDVPLYFYETWLFKFLLAFALVLVMAGLWLARERRYIKQKDVLEALVSQRTAELTAANEALLKASNTDALTGLNNRRFILDQMSRLQSQTARSIEKSDDLGLGLLLFDIDHFKQVNDKYGHAAGDEVLRCVAAVLQQQVRDNEFAVRWGGEEFLVVIPQVRLPQLIKVAQRIRQAVEDAACQPRVTTSIGIASWPLPGVAQKHNWEHALELADFCLYMAKKAGRNCCAVSALTREAKENWPELLDSALLEQWAHQGLLAIEVVK